MSTLKSYNPFNGEIVWEGTISDEAAVNQAVTDAKHVFQTWSKTPLEERFALVRRFAEKLTEAKEAMAKTIAIESGKPFWDALGEVNASIGKIELSIQAYQERTGLTEKQIANGNLKIQHRAHGVMAVLGPFNFPLHLPNGHIVPALIAGNTVVFKPSEMTPKVAALTLVLWKQAGLPEGVLNLIQGGKEPAQQLVQNTDVNGVLFTGGVPAGLAIHRALAGHPEKIVALELGGNNPLIAWDIQHIQDAAKIIVRSAFISAGQRCTCTRRLIVPNNEHGQTIVEAVCQLVDQLTVDNPMAQPEPFMGTLISAQAVEHALQTQSEWLENGAIALWEAQALDISNACMSAGVLDITDMQNRQDEEVFAPLLQVIRVDTFEAAIAEANNTRFGLAAGLIADDVKLFEQFQAEIHAGIVNFNAPTTGASGAAPFGGVGLSGNHRPAGFYAADYCAYPIASMIQTEVSDKAAIQGVIA